MLWVSLILSVATHSLISPQPQPARGINELSIIVERARSAHFQHRIKIDSICKEEIKKSTQNEIEMQDKCKFSQRGRELGTRIASVETAACVRLVANQHQAPGTKHQAQSNEQRATSIQPKWSQTSQREAIAALHRAGLHRSAANCRSQLFHSVAFGPSVRLASESTWMTGVAWFDFSFGLADKFSFCYSS